MKNRSLAAVAAVGGVLSLAACATGPTPYQPQTPQSPTGYSDQQITQNRYRVTFSGNADTSRETVENYLLYNAAEVTLKAGYQWFMFDTRNTQANTTYMSTFQGWPGWHGYGWYEHDWWGPGWGPMGMDQTATTRPITRYNADAEIVFLTPEVAKGVPSAVNAQEVVEHLKPLIRLPNAAGQGS